MENLSEKAKILFNEWIENMILIIADNSPMKGLWNSNFVVQPNNELSVRLNFQYSFMAENVNWCDVVLSIAYTEPSLRPWMKIKRILSDIKNKESDIMNEGNLSGIEW